MTLPRLAFYRRILAYYRRDTGRILLMVALILASTVIGVVLVWPMAWLVDSVLVPGPLPASNRIPFLPDSWAENRGWQIGLLAALLLGLRVLQEGVNAWRNLLNIDISHRGLLRVRCDLYQKLQILSMPFHRSQPQGDTIYRLSNDALGCQQILNVLIEVFVAACTLVVMLFVMLSRSVELTLIALAVVPPLIATNILFGKALSATSRDARRLDSDFTSTIQRAVATIGLTQAFSREMDEFRRFRVCSESSLDAWYTLHRQMAWYRICVGLVFGIGASAIFGYGGWQAYRDQCLGADPSGMTAGSLMMFATYLGMLYDPLCKLTGAGASVLGGVTGMERVFEVLDRDGAITDSPNAVSLPVAPRTLGLNNLSFAYEPTRPVLRNIHLSIPPGEMVAFVGNSGVGKSTILSLLSRFFDPSGGQVELDGNDIRSIKLADLRRHIAVVFQDNLVLPTTVAENIAYGRPEATLDEIRGAAQLAGAAEFIEMLPQGYQTHLSEGGQNLSGGQRQRIAIARALLTKAPIIALDEPTSALDPQHEAQITETLSRLKGQRTILLVSHRLSTVVHCDRILVMQEGRVVDSGAHDELLSRPGWYADMSRRQLAGHLLAQPA